MRIGHSGHLSYCTNIHAGESWQEVFNSLEIHLLAIKKNISKEAPFGIGLRLSYQAVHELNHPEEIEKFKTWLDQNHLYVFTLNGFPYGNFHGEVIKDQVHSPDWTTKERKNYTLLLFDLLVQLLPEQMDGGISTSPISYRFWHATEKELHEAKSKACKAMIDVVNHLVQLKKTSGKSMHLDIEPEPDGILENSEEFIAFYKEYLLKEGAEILMKEQQCSREEAQQFILEHIQLCFDVCHFSIAYEKPADVVEKMHKHGIRIGKIQLSAALKCQLENEQTITELQAALRPFHEPSYLHQAVIKSNENGYTKFRDLDVAITAMNSEDFKELRTHYHVPIFLPKYEKLTSTQDDLIETLSLWNRTNFTQHLEVETYTWDVLPNQMQTDIVTAVTRELNWVKHQIENAS
jgi:hypothetical protein